MYECYACIPACQKGVSDPVIYGYISHCVVAGTWTWDLATELSLQSFIGQS